MSQPLVKGCFSQHPERKGSKVAFHPNRILSIISNLYSTPLAALEEAIQNAVDSHATRIDVVVNLRNRYYVVEDNGVGMSTDKFDEVASNIGKSSKDQTTNYGMFGLGLIAFYGKFTIYHITSTPKDTKGRVGWEGYHTHDIGDMTEDDEGLTIPCYYRQDLAKGNVPAWNTRVVAEVPVVPNVRLAFTIGKLAEEIAQRYGERIAEYKATLTITLVPRQGKTQQRKIEGAPKYRGKALKEIRDHHDECGSIHGQLWFREDKGGTFYIRPGKGLNRLVLSSKLIDQLATLGLPKDTIDNLASGWFDGEIACEQLAQQEDRLSLVESEALLGFLIWLEQYNHDNLEGITAHIDDDAEMKLDRVLLIKVAERLRGINLDYFTDLIGTISTGAAISRGHTHLDDSEKTPDGTSTLSKDRAGEPIESKTRPPRDPEKKRSERQSMNHIDVFDNPGHARKFSKNQHGIRLCYDDMRGSSAHFQWEPEYSLLVINRRHPDFVHCKGDPDRKLVYVETLVKIALPLQLLPEDTEGYSLARESLVRLLLHEVINPTIKKRGRPRLNK